MKKRIMRVISLLLATSISLVLVACGSGSTDTGSGSVTGNTEAEASVSTGDYPIKPEELGSGDVKWSEEETGDGWTKVTNDGGTTLGYSKDSGVSLIQVDGYAFKDLDKDGELDAYEDWRLDDNSRAADLASDLSAEEAFNLMSHGSIMSVSDGLDSAVDNGTLRDCIESGYRTILSFDTSASADVQVSFNNEAQALSERLDYGIPFNISSNERTFDVFPGNLAIAATFNTDLAEEISIEESKMYVSVGVSTVLGPQIDITTEPRWTRVESALGEDPALSRDLTNAMVSGLQSTYSEDGIDEGWGDGSVNAMIKHFPGDGAAESGRESHESYGKYTVYPGDNFAAHLINFFDGGLNLSTATEQSAGVMTSYSIAYAEDGQYGELVGSAFSDWKISLLRDNGYDGLICSDWGILYSTDSDEFVKAPWGYEDATMADRVLVALEAGVDQFGGSFIEMDEPGIFDEVYSRFCEDVGEDEALASLQNSARRILVTFAEVGLFDNPYVSSADAEAILADADAAALGTKANLDSIVMLKNANDAITEDDGTAATQVVYIPYQYSAGNAMYGIEGGWSLPIDLKTAYSYYAEVVTDSVDADGNIVRASAEDLARCDVALVFVNNPENTYSYGYNTDTNEYIPLSLQYGEYKATSQSVRSPSISGDGGEVAVANPYGNQTSTEKEDRSYFGKTAVVSNTSDLDGILYAADNMPADAKVIVCANCTRAMIVNEFESEVDGILVGFNINNEYFLDVATGKHEPNGLLPIQFPANMETVEAQEEDVPRDMECHVDTEGNAYDFAYGLNWSGVIDDERVQTYNAAPLTYPDTITINYAN